jgi:hypothetical protein
LIHGGYPGSWNGPVLAWGETRSTAALGTELQRFSGSGSPVLDALLSGPRSAPEAAATVHRKSWLAPVRQELGCRLEGSGPVSTLSELRRMQDRCDRAWGGNAPWVLKGDCSAAGRERVLNRSGAVDDSGTLQAAERLLSRQGSCLFEPWLDRTFDFGLSLLVGNGGVRLAGVHRLLVRRTGRFLGVVTGIGPDDRPGPIVPERFLPFLPPRQADRMAAVASGVGQVLFRSGYRGHAGIDAWCYRDRDGRTRLNPLGEINGRLTFGLVAAVLAQRIGATIGAGPGTRFRLRFGPGAPRDDRGTFPLVLRSGTVTAALDMLRSAEKKGEGPKSLPLAW